MDQIAQLTQGLLPFVMYFGTAMALLFSFMFIYMKTTPTKEMGLVKENNAAASLALAGAFLGFSLPLASAAANSVGLLDFAVWGLIAGVIQVVTYQFFRMFYPLVSERIERGELAVSIKLAAISVSVGILNAACMTY